MARQQPAALVFAGPVSRGTLSRLPGLRQHLVWIKSSSIATASRAVHALRCGRAVSAFADFEDATVVFISVPDHAVEAAVQELADCGLSWRGRTAILYDSGCTRGMLTPLSSRGAETASLIYHAKPEQFLVDGTPEAIRTVRLFTLDTPLLHLRSCADYRQAMRLTTEDFYPLFAEAMEAFHKAGMTRVQAERTTATMIAESARTWLRAGKRLFKKKRSIKPPA